MHPFFERQLLAKFRIPPGVCHFITGRGNPGGSALVKSTGGGQSHGRTTATDCIGPNDRCLPLGSFRSHRDAEKFGQFDLPIRRIGFRDLLDPTTIVGAPIRFVAMFTAKT